MPLRGDYLLFEAFDGAASIMGIKLWGYNEVTLVSVRKAFTCNRKLDYNRSLFLLFT